MIPDAHTKPMRRMPAPLAERGFTLLELLVALAIFAILAVMAYRGLDVVLASDRTAQIQAQRLATLQTVYRLMGRDIEQAAARSIRDQFGDRQAALLGDSSTLELSRAGRRNPAHLPRSRIQRVGYQLGDDRLMRSGWAVLDRAQDAEPSRSEVLEQVEELGFRYLDRKQGWQAHWPIQNDDASRLALPMAVEVTLTLKDFGQVVWLFRVPDGVVPVQAKNGGA
ncbi:MAG: type II secretion system protein GspJ [Gammaproteobacteria bacterium]|nr:type II secretion system protein GspJ [Gammaproteobacteria bacterium]